MTELAQTSRIEELDKSIIRRLCTEDTSAEAAREMHDAAPGLSVGEVDTLGVRLGEDGYLFDRHEKHKTLVGVAAVSIMSGDEQTTRSIRAHLFKRLDLVGAGLIWLEEKKYAHTGSL